MDRWIGALGVTLLAATVLTAFACGSNEENEQSGGTANGTISLEQDDYYFKPAEISGEAGKPIQVKLENEGKTSHSFTIDELKIDQVVKAGETATLTVTPNAKGSLAFYCRFHRDSNGMKGTLTVSGGSGGGVTSPTSSSSTSSGGGYSGGGY